MDQRERIQQMEAALNQCTGALQQLEAGLHHYASIRETLRTLTAYYESPLWMRDYDDDTAGKLPADLARGVLSQDAVYDLLTDEARLLEEMRDLCSR